MTNPKKVDPASRPRYILSMQKRWLFLFLVILCLACVSRTSPADPPVLPSSVPAPAPKNAPPDHPVYLTGMEEIWSHFPKCPAPGSETDLLDLDIILSIQASRTDEQKKEAVLDKSYSIKLVTNVIDPAFQTKYPNTWQFLLQADRDAYFVTSMLKKANARPRPYIGHPVLVLPLFTVKDFSYPSGHASGTELQARLLGRLFPSQADALLDRARQIADSRVVAGVHYPTDIEEGRILGDELFTRLEAVPRFQSDLKAAAAQDQIPLK